MGIYIKIILFGYIIDSVDLKLSDFEESIFGIGFGGIIVFVLGIKYYWDIKGSGIEICVLFLIWRVVSDILGRNV